MTSGHIIGSTPEAREKFVEDISPLLGSLTEEYGTPFAPFHLLPPSSQTLGPASLGRSL